MPGGHDNAVPGMQHMLRVINSDFARAVQGNDQRVARGAVGADFLALVDGEKRQAKGAVLCQGLADDLPRQLVHLLRQGQRCRVIQIFEIFFHARASCIYS